MNLQQDRMREMLKHAYENVPYYHAVFRERGIYPDDFRTIEDLRKLPILKKSDVRGMPQRLTATNVQQNELVSCQTSGTTAVPMRFYRTREDVYWGTAAWLRAYRWGTWDLGDKYAVIWALDDEEVRSPRRRFVNLLRREHLLLNAYKISESTIRSSARRIEELRPKFLLGYGHSIHLLAKYLLAEGKSPLKLNAILVTTQTLLASERRDIEKAFGCEAYDLYGSREFSLIGSECGQHMGYHINSENVVLEFSKDGEPVSPGETGRVLVTSLHNYAMPFIRYDIGDMGKPSDDTCSCGRGLPLFKSLQGRTYEYLVDSDGSIIFLKDLDIFFEALPVDDFQVVQRKPDDILVKLVKTNEYSDKDTEFVRKNILWNNLQETIKVEVKIVESIPSENSGKKRYFINEVGEEANPRESNIRAVKN